MIRMRAYTGIFESRKAKLRAFPHSTAWENTQLSPSLTRKPCSVRTIGHVRNSSEDFCLGTSHQHLNLNQTPCALSPLSSSRFEFSHRTVSNLIAMLYNFVSLCERNTTEVRFNILHARSQLSRVAIKLDRKKD